MKLIRTICCLLFSCQVFAQSNVIDSLARAFVNQPGDRAMRWAAVNKIVDSLSARREYDSILIVGKLGLSLLPNEKDSAAYDTTCVKILAALGSNYQFENLDSAILCSSRALSYAQRLNYKLGEAVALGALGENYRLRGDFLEALGLLFRSLSIFRELHNRELEGVTMNFMGIAYIGLGEYRAGLNSIFEGMVITPKFSFDPMRPFMVSYLGDAYEGLNNLDSALYYHQIADSIATSLRLNMAPLRSAIYSSLGRTFSRRGNQEAAIHYYRQSIHFRDHLNLGPAQFRLADLYYNNGNSDSSLYYARLGFIKCQEALEYGDVANASRLLAKIFLDRKQIDSAYFYQKIALSIADSLYSPQKFNKLQVLVAKEQQKQFENAQRQKESEQERENLTNRIKVYGLLAILAAFFIIAAILYRNNKQKQRANEVLNQTLSELKNTQNQLVQSEKMASLGELTAGIAHEIQNPLNFVNNFSELNKELVVDMNLELERGNYEEAKKIAVDIVANEIKINEHGRRAESIVKGMLQHSRTSTGQKEPTDINALCDEYLRLCYHGMRARDKSFNANMELQLDKTIGKIDVVPQDFGRVLLNICNNAFHAVNEKRMKSPNGYSPEVMLATRRIGNAVEITIKDNGNGIPEKNLDKIFQPFFTTKPTGQGTGLGLSLSYDIIKAHGGKIEVSSKEGVGTEFLIQLPI